MRVNEEEVLERVVARLPPHWKQAAKPQVDTLYSLRAIQNRVVSPVRRYNLLYAGVTRIARTQDAEELFSTLESCLHFNVAVSACRKLFVHAGVVGWRARAIVIPGRSLSGKSSLVAALVRAGATYYSDEYAVLDSQGRVHPYAKSLSMREVDGRPAKHETVEALGGRIGTRPVPVGLIVVTSYNAQARWRPRALSEGEALLAMMDNTVLTQIKPEIALPTLQRAVAGAQCLRGRRGEAEDVAASLLKRLG